jgi:hypothetical protein
MDPLRWKPATARTATAVTQKVVDDFRQMDKSERKLLSQSRPLAVHINAEYVCYLPVALVMAVIPPLQKALILYPTIPSINLDGNQVFKNGLLTLSTWLTGNVEKTWAMKYRENGTNTLAQAIDTLRVCKVLELDTKYTGALYQSIRTNLIASPMPEYEELEEIIKLGSDHSLFHCAVVKMASARFKEEIVDKAEFENWLCRNMEFATAMNNYSCKKQCERKSRREVAKKARHVIAAKARLNIESLDHFPVLKMV